jgi:hypothetical protein
MSEQYDDEDEQFYSSTDAAHIKAAKDFQRNWDNQANEDLRVILSTEGGRRVVARILGACDINAPIGSEPFEAQRALGRRDVGLELLEWVFTSDDQAFTIMETEARIREQLRKDILNV